MVNLALNLLWIPRYDIERAAIASTISYSLTLLAQLFLYCRLSGNSWIQVLIPTRMDLAFYLTVGRVLVKGLKKRTTSS